MIIYRFSESSSEALDRIKSKYGDLLSQDYLEFLDKTNGGKIKRSSVGSFRIPQTDITIKPAVFFGLDTEQEYDLEYINELKKADIPEKSVIIGVDGLGGYIMLLQEEGKIYTCYWDENLQLPLSSEDANAYPLTRTFRAFLNRFGNLIVKESSKGDEEMDRIDYVPLGSIIMLNGGIEKILVTSRGIMVKNGGKEVFFDYAGVLYPQGLIGDSIIYFNHSGIAKVVFEGYKDEEDEITVNNINKYLEEHPDLERGDVNSWTQE